MTNAHVPFLAFVMSALLLGLALNAARAAAMTHEERDGPRKCLAISDAAARLACYDDEVRRMVKPSYEGRLHLVTDPFAITVPTLLRYQSDGPIFVLYLKAADGSVVQNLHIGGGGENSYLIEQSGTYFLDINGSESWRIWLEPAPNTKVQ